ncbi:M20 family metallopeptidase [Sphaerobacter sp.]|uniref:M20 family metallopeptidase n=1 Tax=Sphaerobacter sp. TaxID=2099654 RepID=UPI0025F55D0F|nr:M20 family metallopeptidase [Sphaerobacter sp.]
MSTTGNLEAAREAILAKIDAERDNLIALSKFIHANPEIALQEVKASAACADFLAERGFSVERGVADLPTAFHASTGEGRPHVGYLSEYDALPGVGHGCGHNLIAIAGIGAGIGLAAALPHVGGRVSVFGTPAEEAIGGKVIMARAGVFSGLDAAMGAHPGTSEAAVPYLEGSGQALACQGVKIAFHGKAAHAAADPHNGINALNALIETFNGINALRQHILDDARIHGIITQGGQAPNVVPDYAEGSFLVRASTRAYMKELVEKVRAIAEGAASMTGARLSFEYSEEPYYDMITNYPLARRIKKHLDDLGLQLPDPKVEPGKGSTDWGNVSYEVPSVETSYPIVDRVITWHSQEVVEAADSEMGYANTLTVAKALALTGLDVLTDAALRAEIGLAFERERAARG